MSEHPPVRDWATDFDHTDEAWAADPYPIWDQLRRTCPVAHSDRYGGTWLPTRHEDVAAIAYDTENFTSRSVVVTNYRPPDLAPRGIAPPISSDPPFHAGARRMLLPLMSPHVVAKWEPSTREYCETLVEDLRGRDAIDAAVEYAQHIPVRVIARMLGFPEADADLFRGFVHHVLESVTLPFEQRLMGMQDIFEYLRVQVQDHIENPRDDLTTALLTAHMNDEPVGIEHVGGTVALLLLAGIDTTWSAIGASIWHLGGHPADRERLVAEPQLLPTAIEEFLRAYAPVTMARLAKHDMDWHGCPMKADDWILLSFPSANRDPEFFDRADEVIIDREDNRHAAFGLGIHRCAGSHLARMELRVALEVFLDAFPVFELADPAAVRWSGGQVRGPRTLPLKIG
ncbi:MAG: cytochrome P450 [Acidimicrobiia bacterium]|nr:cytochrome P450 [Acidimicrobiia bacterium]